MASPIENIGRRLRQDEDFVIFKDNKLLDGDGKEIPVNAAPGNNGPTFVPVIAYASDNVGTGFTLTSSDTLDYIAFIVLDATVTPIAAHFAGKWLNRRGIPGTPGAPGTGADGQQAGFKIAFSTTTSADKPGAGNIRFNNSNLALATEMYLDEAMATGVDLSGVINQFVDGMSFMLRSNLNSNTTLAVFELTANPTDNGDWFTIPVINRALSSTSFSNGDQCTFQFFGGGGGSGIVTEAAVLAAGDFLRVADNGNGGVKLIDPANSDMQSMSPVFKLAGFSITGVPTLPAANIFPHGSIVRIHQDCLVGAGANPTGAYLRADAVNNIWRPAWSQILFSKRYGTLAAQTNQLTAAGKFTLDGTAGDPVIPASLLHTASRLILRLDFKKLSGGTTPRIRANLGTDMNIRTNNSIVYDQSMAATNLLEVPGRSEISFLDANNAFCMLRTPLGGSGGASQWLDAVTALNIASAMKLTIEASTLASDTVVLYGFSLSLEE